MGTINVTLGDATQLNLPLGRQLENDVTEVVFDFSAWNTTYGAGTLSLSVQRKGDEMPYPVTMTVSGTDVTWEVTDTDTARKGTGKAQLTYTVGDAVKKSVIYKFTVYESLGADGEYPAPGSTWMEDIEDRVEALEAGDGGGVPSTVRQAMLNLFSKAIYSEAGMQNDVEVIENWATVSVESVSLSPSTLAFSSITSQTITATVHPADASATVTWSSSNTSVATVDENGVVTSVGNGSCTITASAGGKTATCSVTVSGIAQTYSVTNTLTGCVSSNAQTTVQEGASYSATITPDEGYLLPFVSATVTMGGTDITSTAWNDGAITIAEVTGAIVITVSATQDTRVLLYNWDFTQSLFDTKENAEFVLSNSNNGESLPTRDANGLHFTAGEQLARCTTCGGKTTDGRTYEIDVSSAEFAGDNSKHKRFFGSGSGSDQYLIFKNSGQVQIYRGAWIALVAETGQTIPTSLNDFSGKTVAVKLGTDKTYYLYIDGTLIATKPSWVAASYDWGGCIFGGKTGETATAGNQIYNLTITGFRIYGEASS